MRASQTTSRLLALALLLLTAALAHADPAAPDAGFALQKAVVGAGGVHSSGGDYTLDATAGQPAAGRTAEDASEQVLHAGFWTACLAAAPVPPEVAILRNGSDVDLSWPAPPEDAAYQVWVLDGPYLAPDDSGVTPVVTDLTSFTDPGAAGSLVNHFYVLRGLNPCGEASDNSGRTGEFTFGLTPGS